MTREERLKEVKTVLDKLRKYIYLEKGDISMKLEELEQRKDKEQISYHEGYYDALDTIEEVITGINIGLGIDEDE